MKEAKGKKNNRPVSFSSVPKKLYSEFKKKAEQNGQKSQDAFITAMKAYMDTIEKITEKNLTDNVRIINFLSLFQKELADQKKEITEEKELSLFLCEIIGEILKSVPELQNLKSKVDEALKVDSKIKETAAERVAVPRVIM